MPPDEIQMGQTYIGILARQCFPPDDDTWWNTVGSYEIEIVTVGDSEIGLRGYRVYQDGRREPIQEATHFRTVRLNDFENDVKNGTLILRPENAPEQSLDRE